MSEFLELLNTAAAHPEATGATVSGTWAIKKLLGPTVTAIGGAFGDFAGYRTRNVLGIGEKAARRISDNDDQAAEYVHPRVAHAVLEPGSWIDNDLHQEYLAGMLVNARTVDGSSDHSAYLARLVASLTADQVRMHYLMISAYAGYWADDVEECPFPFSDPDQYYHHAVKVDRAEVLDKFPLFNSVATALAREGLVGPFGNIRNGSEETVKIGLVPTPLAYEVFLSALATSDVPTEALMIAREDLSASLATIHTATAIVLPDPEPRLFDSAVIGDIRRS